MNLLFFKRLFWIQKYNIVVDTGGFVVEELRFDRITKNVMKMRVQNIIFYRDLKYFPNSKYMFLIMSLMYKVNVRTCTLCVCIQSVCLLPKALASGNI